MDYSYILSAESRNSFLDFSGAKLLHCIAIILTFPQFVVLLFYWQSTKHDSHKNEVFSETEWTFRRAALQICTNFCSGLLIYENRTQFDFYTIIRFLRLFMYLINMKKVFWFTGAKHFPNVCCKRACINSYKQRGLLVCD